VRGTCRDRDEEIRKDSKMRRTLAILAVLLCALTLATGCGGDSGNGGASASDNTSDAPAEPKVIEVTIEGDSVTPNGERIEVATGQDVELDITADAPGEIHVHSTPEQEFEYEQGTSTVTIKGIEQPGTVDVEVHDPEKVIVQLEVS
jgi:ABC-type glycerol-3-phosphate transport system substrate-binding protein